MHSIVVGGSSGIGSAIADRLRKEGHDVLTMQRGDPIIPVAFEALDLRWGRAAIGGAVDRAVSTLGGLDNVIIAGGVGAYTKPRPLHNQVEEMMQTNYMGPRWVFNQAARYLKTPSGERASRVLYISSCIVRNPTKGLEDYAASKAAGETFFRAIGKRYAKWGIRSNVLRTGWIETPMVADIDPALKEAIRKNIPLQRLGTAEEAADMAYSLVMGPDYLNMDLIEMTGGL